MIDGSWGLVSKTRSGFVFIEIGIVRDGVLGILHTNAVMPGERVLMKKNGKCWGIGVTGADSEHFTQGISHVQHVKFTGF